MTDHEARHRDPLQPITQPQLPPSGVILVRDTAWPGKVFDLKASQLWRRRVRENPELVAVIEPSAGASR